MKASTIIIAALALLSAGLATGIVTTINRNRELTAQLGQARPTLAQAVTDVDTTRLRQLLEEQEFANANLRDELNQLRREATNKVARPAPAGRGINPDRPPNPSGPGGQAWLERLKQEDPERYKQIVQQREQRRKAMEQWLQDTVDQLDQRAAIAPTKEEADVAGAIADALVKLSDLRAQWEALRNLPEDQRQAQTQDLAAQTRDVQQQLRDLSQQDRTLQLQNYAHSIGYTDESSVNSFVAGVSAIYSNTSYRAIVGPGWGGGPGGRGGGPPANTGTSATTTTSPTPKTRP